MPSYKLTYFDLMGRAETARLIFAYAGVDYEDHRFKREDWPALKPTLPFKVVPVLTVDGQQLSQSMTINRYLGRELGLHGRNSWEDALIDQYADAMVDVMAKLTPVAMGEPDEEKKKEKLAVLFKESVVPLAQIYEGALAANPAGYLVGDRMTWCDLFVFQMISTIFSMAPPGATDAFTNLNKFLAKVGGNDRIKAWLEKRPKTPF